MTVRAFFNQIMTVYPKASYNRYGRVVTTTGTEENCRFQKGTRSVLMPNGQTKVIEGIIYTKAGLSVNINDRIDYAGDKYQVFSKSEPVDGSGNVNHLKLELTKWQETST